MKLVIKILKGALIGMSIIVPGISGGSMAMSMGIYNRLIELVTIDKNKNDNFKELFPYIIGTVLGVAVFAFFIELALSNYPFYTACLFLGMILGCLPMLIGKVKGHGFLLRHGIILIITLLVMAAMIIADKNATKEYVLDNTIRNVVLSLGLGLVSAATMVVPGISGSMVLMALGYYQSVLHHVNTFTLSLINFNWSGAIQAGIILAPFTLGVILGIVIIARGIRALLKYFPLSTYYGIIGLVVASSFVVLYHQDISGLSFINWALGLIFTALGFFAAFYLGKGETA